MELVLEAVASTPGMSPLFCNGNSVYGSLLTWLSSQYVHFLVLFTWNLFHINYGQLTHEKILICLIFPHFQLYLHKLRYFEMHADHVNSTLTLSTRVYTMSILLFLFFLIFTVLYIAPPIPVRLQWFWQNPVESSAVQRNGTGFQWIPQDCRQKLK